MRTGDPDGGVQPSTEVGIRSNLQEDVYITYAGSIGGTEEAVYRFTINPLVWWVWYGGLIMALGGLIVMWPQATRAGTRRAEGGYVVVMKPQAVEHETAEAGV